MVTKGCSLQQTSFLSGKDISRLDQTFKATVHDHLKPVGCGGLGMRLVIPPHIKFLVVLIYKTELEVGLTRNVQHLIQAENIKT